MSTSISTLGQYLKRRGHLNIPNTGVRAAVVVKDVRSHFGRIELLVTPVAGHGEGWHELGKGVELDKEGV